MQMALLEMRTVLSDFIGACEHRVPGSTAEKDPLCHAEAFTAQAGRRPGPARHALLPLPLMIMRPHAHSCWTVTLDPVIRGWGGHNDC